MTDTSPLRWHASEYPELRDSGDTVEAHQIRVAVMCQDLAAYIKHPLHNSDLLKAARYHDEAERSLGDTPAPAKARFPELAAAYAKAEAKVLAEMGFTWTLTNYEAAVLDLCDKLDAYLWAAAHIDVDADQEWIDARSRLRFAAFDMGEKVHKWLEKRLESVKVAA